MIVDASRPAISPVTGPSPHADRGASPRAVKTKAKTKTGVSPRAHRAQGSAKYAFGQAILLTSATQQSSLRRARGIVSNANPSKTSRPDTPRPPATAHPGLGQWTESPKRTRLGLNEPSRTRTNDAHPAIVMCLLCFHPVLLAVLPAAANPVHSVVPLTS